MKTTRTMTALLSAVLILSLTPAGQALAQICTVPPAGLVSWWPGDGTFDDIADANNGTNAGGTTFTTGKVAQAFSFSGDANSFITVPNSPNMLPASNQLTIDAWVKPNFSVANQWDNILAKRDGCGAPGNSYNFGINKGDSSDVFGAIAFAMSSPAGGITRATSGSTTVPNDGMFHHVAATYDGSNMKVYLDGQLVGQAARSGPIVGTASAPVISHHGGSCPQRAAAVIDEIEFHDRALLPAEILAIFNADSAGKCKDSSPPTFGDCPAGGPFLPNSGVHAVGPITAEDAESGIDADASTLSGSVDTSSPGTKTVTFVAVNNEGNEATKDCDYNVHYQFSGFFSPVDNLPTVNATNAGSAVPVKFSLSGNYGLNIFASGYPKSQAIACDTASPVDPIEETVTAGSSGLSYDAGADQYNYVWKTAKPWAKSCRQLIVKLNDGSDHVAYFSFK